MFSEETSVFSVECYFAMFSDIAKTGSGSSRALSELVEFIFPLPYHHSLIYFFLPHNGRLINIFVVLPSAFSGV